ncbi:MAG: hypothetical protein LCI00_28930 [Chloroflexi bacterium]|nr:hypothetical protein [Chloroflexota bacterium]MCC6896754.1 hypothetical protein [Anaerolineae bacterium]
MPISVKWFDDSHTCVVVTYQGRWSWAEFQTAVDETNQLLNTVEHKVAIIEDTAMGGMLPPGNIVANGRNAIASFPKNISLIIVVLNSSLIRTFLTIIASMNPGGHGSIIKITATLEEALDMAEQRIPNS